MKLIRIYQEGHYGEGEQVTLSPEAAQHVLTVLRLNVGDQLNLFSGDGSSVLGEIVATSKRGAKIHILKALHHSVESFRRITLAQGVSKGERMDLIVQKAVELGVTEIYPLLTERCVVRLDENRWAKKIKHWQGIAISACEQCGRNIIPKIHPVISLHALTEKTQAQNRIVLHPEAEHSFKSIRVTDDLVQLVIGPEGGLTPEEINFLKSKHFQTVRMGPRILRTETAALTALSIIQFQFGDLSANSF